VLTVCGDGCRTMLYASDMTSVAVGVVFCQM